MHIYFYCTERTETYPLRLYKPPANMVVVETPFVLTAGLREEDEFSSQNSLLTNDPSPAAYSYICTIFPFWGITPLDGDAVSSAKIKNNSHGEVEYCSINFFFLLRNCRSIIKISGEV